MQGWRSVMLSGGSQLRRRNSYPKCPFGAAHRPYVDTPPLVGRCRALQGALERVVWIQQLAFSRALQSALAKHT